VHVWRADLDAVEERLCDVLDTAERQRAQRILRPQDRQRWARSRAVLRALLGRYLHADPRTLTFALGAHGKPTLPSISFNLSHSASLALYALVLEGDVGVDVELARRPLDALALAESALGAQEAAGQAGALAARGRVPALLGPPRGQVEVRRRGSRRSRRRVRSARSLGPAAGRRRWRRRRRGRQRRSRRAALLGVLGLVP
jgi:hypothetical protein